MKSKWLPMTKIQLMGLFGINKAKNSADPAVKRKAAGGLAALAIVGAVMIFYIVLIAVSFCRQGIGQHLPALTIALTSLITLLFSLLHGCSSLFAMKDYDLVMSLPVTKRDILISRLLCSYIANLAFALGVAIPCLVVLFVMDGFSVSVLAVTIVGAVFAPLLPMAVAITVSALLTALTAGFKYKNLLQSLLGIIAFVGIMIASFSISFGANAEQDIDMNAMYRLLVADIYPPALLIEMTLDGTIWAIFLFIGASLLIAVAFVLVLSLGYHKIHDALTAKSARSAYRAKEIRSSSALSALTKREFKRLLTCPAYLLNGLSGTLLLLIAGIALLFVNVQESLIQMQLPIGSTGELAYAGFGIFIFSAGISCPSASALSLEGNSRGQLFVLPVPARKILLAKALPTFMINTAAGYITSIIFCIKIGADLPGWITLLISVPLFCAFIAIFGIFLNLKFPKYDWTTEIQAVKQSIPVMIAVFGSMILGFAAIFLGILVGFWIVLALDILCIVCSITCWLYFKNVRLCV